MTRIARRPAAPPAAIVLALLPLLAAGCNDDGTGVSEPIAGTWFADGLGGTLFVVITDADLVYYTAADADDCVDRSRYELEHQGGNEYLLRSTINTATLTSTISARDGELTWATDFGTIIFQRSTADPASMPVCAGGGDDPALTCPDLPALEVGQTVLGALGEGDPSERGWIYDVYSFEPDAPLTAGITLGSPDFDAYLYVYDANGVLLAENDDAAEGSLNAGITLQFNPVCYRVEVTSLSPGETGAYTVLIE